MQNNIASIPKWNIVNTKCDFQIQILFENKFVYHTCKLKNKTKTPPPPGGYFQAAKERPPVTLDHKILETSSIRSFPT